MKRVFLLICAIMIIMVFTVNKLISTHSSEKVPNETGFYNQNPLENKLLSREEFFDLIKSSSYAVPYCDNNEYYMITLKNLIDVVGKPQKEKECLNLLSGSGIGRTDPRCKCFIWELKDNMVISYDVMLSDDCPEEEATLDNLLEYGIVYNLYKVPITGIVLPDGYFESVSGDTG